MHAATKQISCTTAAVKTDSIHSALPSKWKFPSKTPKLTENRGKDYGSRIKRDSQ
jgi:hypothetical protein